MQTINFELDQQSKFTSISTAISGVQAEEYLAAPHNTAPYHTDMKWGISDYILAYGGKNVPGIERLIDSHTAEHAAMRKTGLPSTAQGVGRQWTGEWMGTICHKRVNRDKTISGNLVTTPMSELFHGWSNRLDWHKRELALHNGEKLNEKDLHLLNHFLLGVPRKVTARSWDVSVKAIEKRLAKIKHKLYHSKCQCYSLHGCINHHKLTAFLLANPNWFDLEVHHWPSEPEKKWGATGLNDVTGASFVFR